jgi:hypothetical protein
MRVIFVFFLIISSPLSFFAQDLPPVMLIKLHGSAIDAQTGYGLHGLMVLNQRTKTGVFGAHDGYFSVSIEKNDTIKFSVIGYSTISISFKDSLFKPSYHVVIKMEKLKIDLLQLEVFPYREYTEIKKDIDELGVKYQYQTQGFAGLASPITFFYERFSHFEKQRKQAAELYNEAAKKDILKELFRNYIRADISELTPTEFDDFLLFCSMPEAFIKSATQYELIVSLKNCYEVFLKVKK